MTVGLVGKKLGMTRVFTSSGESIPVTVIEVLQHRVVCLKSNDRDGYEAIQITTGKKRLSKVKKPMAGHYAKAQVEAGRGLWEFRGASSYQVGDVFDAALFTDGQMVDVQGVTKGRGFAGTVKRHNFRTQDATHGNSRAHRVPGSIGQNQSPGRVFKGKKMTGHMGCDTRTIQNLSVVRVDLAKQVVLIRGAIPGAPGGDVIIYPAVKCLSSNAVAAS